LTIIRNKFSIPDFSEIFDKNIFDGLVYGLFAETNILFGLTAIMRMFTETGVYIGLQPFLDSILELIPRIILPGRSTGEYVYFALLGLISDEGLVSHTAYPYVGEFLMMLGWSGFFFGSISYGILYRILHLLSLRSGSTQRVAIAGVGLAAALVGYYHYSRGYLPQAVKGYVFVFAPFIYMAFRDKRVLQRIQMGRQLASKPWLLRQRESSV
jgi:hypothetical protein